MGYSSTGRRPFESASKSAHHHLVNDPAVQQLLKRLHVQPRAQKTALENVTWPFVTPPANPIQHVIAIDGSYSEAVLEREFPSRLIHFLQFGALWFRREDLERLEQSSFISPEDMAKLRNIERLKLVLPTRNVRLQDERNLACSVMRIIAEFFLHNRLGEDKSLMDTLAWFVFRRYKGNQRNPTEIAWDLATNPYTGTKVQLRESELNETDYTFSCPTTGRAIRLTDIFRLHEVLNEETGATGILGYVLNVIEHLIIVHVVRSLLELRPSLLRQILFIKDGPCGFFGQTANLHKPMRDLTAWLLAKHGLFLVGLEKSGAFVEHAREIQDRVQPGEFLVLSNQYIYDYIVPDDGDPNRPYGSTTMYGHKVIFKTRRSQMHVVSIPCPDLKITPAPSDLPNLHLLLANVEELHCDMYDSALFPVALVNKLVSLSAHPSQRILQNFAKQAIG